MKSMRVALVTALLFSALVLLTFGATNLVAAPIWFVFRRGTDLGTFNLIAQIAACIAITTLLIAGAMIAIPTALQPATWVRKSLYVLPVYLLTMTVAAILANVFGIATLGSLTSASSPIKIPFATVWLGTAAVLGTIAVTIAVARANLSYKILRLATILAGVTVVPVSVLGFAMLGAINVVLANQSKLPSGDGQPPAPPGAPVGPGPSGGIASVITTFQTGGGLMAAFALVALLALVVGVRAWRRLPNISGMPTAAINYRREAVRAGVSAIGISIILLLAMQLVPVPRDNPPVLASVQWDSPQTQALVTRTCLNCHSNQTEWPWYAAFAPGSWITYLHVHGAREQFNLSELNQLPAFRRTRLARDMADQIRADTMPPVDYRLLHPEANLTSTEKEQLIQGLLNSIK